MPSGCGNGRNGEGFLTRLGTDKRSWAGRAGGEARDSNLQEGPRIQYHERSMMHDIIAGRTGE
jgi:hypothetical protein